MNRKKVNVVIVATIIILISLGVLLKSWIPVIPVIAVGLILAYIYFGWNYGGYKLVTWVNTKAVPNLKKVILFCKNNIIGIGTIAIAIALLILLLSISNCNGCNSNKRIVNSSGEVPEVTTEEENSSTKEETIRKEETTSVEDTTEEETTSVEEATKKNSSSNNSSNKGNSSNKTSVIRNTAVAEEIPETTTLTKEEKESLGVVETSGSVNRVKETTMKVPEVETTKKEVETTTSKKVEATTAAPKEEEQEVTIKNPFEEEETTNPEVEITVPMLPTETLPVANANVTISYTPGATKANALVTLDGGRAEGVWFSVKWKGAPTDGFKAVKNPDGSYSIKVDVPQGCNSKLIITVFDKDGNELGESSKIIKN